MEELHYAKTGRRMSKAGITSLVLGIAVIGEFMYIAHVGLPPTTSVATRWMLLGPAYLAEITGFVLGLIAIVKLRRFWWLGIGGLLLNSLALAGLLLAIIRRFAS